MARLMGLASLVLAVALAGSAGGDVPRLPAPVRALPTAPGTHHAVVELGSGFYALDPSGVIMLTDDAIVRGSEHVVLNGDASVPANPPAGRFGYRIDYDRGVLTLTAPPPAPAHDRLRVEFDFTRRPSEPHPAA